MTESINITNKTFTLDKHGSEIFTNEFTKIIQLMASSSLTVKRTVSNLPHKKWFDSECKNSKQNLNRLARNCSSHPFCTEIRSIYHSERNKHSRLMKQRRSKFLSRLNESIENGHCLDWKKFKQLKQTNENKISLDKFDLLSFYEYFTNLYKKSDNDPEFTNLTNNFKNLNKDATSSQTKILNEPMSKEELDNALKKLHVNKSTSEDAISNEMLKNINPSGHECMLKLFNHCLTAGTYPWHTSVITPIFKAGDPYNPDNYRAIAVGSCLGKLFSSILLDRLIQFKDQYCKDPSEQLGFTKGAQTNDHILTLKTMIDKYTKKQRGKLHVCFVDLKKAFDTVSRDLLLFKLVKLGIRGNFFAVIEDMYSNSLSKIKIDKLLSPAIKMERGTEQGHPLSPDLFKLFIRDMSEIFYTVGDYPYLSETLITHLLWADDLVLAALDVVSLQDNITALHQFCNKWGLSINIKKTKIVIFQQRKQSDDTCICYLGDDLIETVSSYCYLGIVFDSNGTFKTATNELRKKSLRAQFGMRGSIMKDSLSLKSLFVLFDSLIKPVYLYGCQVLAPYSDLAKYFSKDLPEIHTGEQFLKKVASDPYEKLHLKYIKWCLSVHPKSSNVGSWGDTGRYPLFFDAIKISIDYYKRAMNADTNSLLYAAYNEQVNLGLDWYRHIKGIIDKFGTGCSSHESINTRQNLQNVFCSKWTEAKTNSKKLEFYNTLKQEFGAEKYLHISNVNHRHALSRLRISAHNLFIERGRYTKPITPREERVCLFCLHNLNLRKVESEQHVIEDCGLYSAIRNNIRTTVVSKLKTPISTLFEIFANRADAPQLDSLAGKMAFYILETNEKFSLYISQCSNFYYTSTGRCAIL